MYVFNDFFFNNPVKYFNTFILFAVATWIDWPNLSN